MGGLVQTVPVHATVTMSDSPAALAQLTITTGSGYSMFPPRHVCFAMRLPLPMRLFMHTYMSHPLLRSSSFVDGSVLGSRHLGRSRSSSLPRSVFAIRATETKFVGHHGPFAGPRGARGRRYDRPTRGYSALAPAAVPRVAPGLGWVVPQTALPWRGSWDPVARPPRPPSGTGSSTPAPASPAPPWRGSDFSRLVCKPWRRPRPLAGEGAGAYITSSRRSRADAKRLLRAARRTLKTGYCDRGDRRGRQARRCIGRVPT